MVESHVERRQVTGRQDVDHDYVCCFVFSLYLVEINQHSTTAVQDVAKIDTQQFRYSFGNCEVVISEAVSSTLMHMLRVL